MGPVNVSAREDVAELWFCSSYIQVLDSFASCETDSLLKFQEEETSSVRVMDIVSGTEQYLLL
jgi:hypothetical protein